MFTIEILDRMENAWYTEREKKPWEEEYKGKIVYFGGIDKLRFKQKVVPGDVLKLEVELIKRRGTIGIAKAVATVNGKVAVQGEITFAIGD